MSYIVKLESKGSLFVATLDIKLESKESQSLQYKEVSFPAEKNLPPAKKKGILRNGLPQNLTKIARGSHVHLAK